MGMPVEPVWEQEDYAFYEDGTESGATLIGAAGAQQNLDVDTVYHCRLLIADTAPGTANANVPDLTLRWEYNLAGGGWTIITGTTAVQFVDNANLTDGGTTTNRDPTGTGTFSAGRIYESANTTAVVISSNGSTQHTEVLLHFQIDSAQVSNGQECLIRCTEGDGTAFATYVNADINIVEAVVTPQLCAGSITALGDPTRRVGKGASGSITTTGILATAKSFLRSVAGTITGTGEVARSVLRTLTGSVAATGVLATTKVVMQLVSGSITGAGVLVKRTGKTLAGSSEATGALIRSTGKKVAGSITGASTLVKESIKDLVGSITGSGTITKRAGKLLTGTFDPLFYKSFESEEILNDPDFDNDADWTHGVDWTISGGLAVSSGSSAGLLTDDACNLDAEVGDVIEMRIAGSIGGTLSPILGGAGQPPLPAGGGVLVKRYKITTVTTADQFGVTQVFGTSSLSFLSFKKVWSLQKEAQVSRLGSITGTGSLAKDIAAFVSGSITATGALLKRIPLSVVGSITSTGALTTTKVILQAIAGSITATGALAKRTGKLITGSITSTGALFKRVPQLVTGSITSTGALFKRVPQLVTGSITAVGSAVGQIVQAATNTLVLFRGAIFRDTDTKLVLFRGRIYKGTATGTGGTTFEQAVAGTITAAGALVTIFGKLLQGAITATGSLTKRAGKLLIGVITTSGSLTKQTIKTLQGNLTLSGILNTIKVVLQAIAGSITASGSLTKQAGKLVTGSITAAGVLAKDISKLVSRFLYMYSGKTGPELIPDPGMDDAGDWTLTGGASITGGRLRLATLSASANPNPVPTYTVGERYAYSFEVQDLLPLLGGGINVAGVQVWTDQAGIAPHTGEGKFDGTVVAQASGVPFEISSSGGPWYVDNYSVKLVNPIQVQVNKFPLGSITASGVLATTKVILQALAGSITASGSLIKQAGKLVTGWLPIQTLGGKGQDDHLRNDASWTKGAGVTHDTQAETATWDGIQALDVMGPNPGIVLGAGDYVATCDITVYNSGTLSFWPGITGSTFLDWPQSTGSHRIEFSSAGGNSSPPDYRWMTGGATFDGTATNLHLYERVGKHLVRDVLTNKVGVLTPEGTLSKDIFKLLVGTITGAGSLVTQLVGQLTQLCAGSITASGTLLKRISLTVVGSITAAGVLVKSIGKLVSGSITSVGVLIKQVGKSLQGSITATASLITQKITGVIQKLVEGSITPVGTLTRIKSFFRTLTGILTPEGSLTKRTYKTFTGSITAVGTLITSGIKSLLIGGVITPVGAIIKQVNVTRVGVVVSAGGLLKYTTKGLSGVISSFGGVTKQINKTLAGAITMLGALFRYWVDISVPVPTRRQVDIDPEWREVDVISDVRIVDVAPEVRRVDVESEVRKVEILPENRGITVETEGRMY